MVVDTPLTGLEEGRSRKKSAEPLPNLLLSGQRHSSLYGRDLPPPKLLHQQSPNISMQLSRSLLTNPWQLIIMQATPYSIAISHIWNLEKKSTTHPSFTSVNKDESHAANPVGNHAYSSCQSMQIIVFSTLILFRVDPACTTSKSTLYRMTIISRPPDAPIEDLFTSTFLENILAIACDFYSRRPNPRAVFL